MPPKGAEQRRQARQSLRSSRGVDAEAINAAGHDPAPRHRVAADSIRKTYFPAIQHRLKGFTRDTYPDDTMSYDKVMAHNSSVTISFGFLSAFMLYWAQATDGQGRSGPDKDQTHLATYIFRLVTFLQLYTETTGLTVDRVVVQRTRTWIRDKSTGLSSVLNISRDPPTRNWCGPEEWRSCCLMILSPAFGITSFLARLRLILWFTLTISTALRVGAFMVKSTRYDQKTLLWKHVELCVFRGRDGASNHLGIRTETVNGKNAGSLNVKVCLADTGPPLFNPVFWLLALAQSLGALPIGWTIDQLYDPATFATRQGDSLVLAFNTSFADEPVFKAEGTASRTGKEWSIHTVNGYLISLGEYCGFRQPLTSHVLRRSVAIGLKAAGELFS